METELCNMCMITNPEGRVLVQERLPKPSNPWAGLTFPGGHVEPGETVVASVIREVREGVKYLPEINTDIFLVTLNKSEKHYSPTTMYLDYAISDELFHWQSQSTTSIESATGKRYLNGSSTVLLFVRENKSTDSISSSYCFLGPAKYVSHRGSRPINITWQLFYKMPARLCRMTERMAIA